MSLSRAIAIAVERNHDVKLSALAVDSADAARISANAAPNPALTVQTANINPHQGIGAGGLRDKAVDTTIRVDQLIERGGKRELRSENAASLERASRADLGEAQRQLRISVSQAYYDLLAAQERQRTTADSALLFDGTVAAAQKRKEAGDIAGAEVERIQVDALRARNDARQAKADLAKAQLALALLMGIEPQEGAIQATDPWPDPQQVVTDAGIGRLIEQRPDIRAARARVDAADAASRLAQASRVRDVSVGVQFEHYPVSAFNGQGSGNSYGVAIQVPLFTRYDFAGEIRSAQVALETARVNLEKTRGAARNELLRTLHDIKAAAEHVQRYQHELLPAAKKSTDAAEYAFRNGAISVMDVLDARRTYRSTQLEAVSAQSDYAKSLAAWRAAILEEGSK
ncbi:MAG TPA: TolC family protein [Burkholderiaceae bacterium]|nr:TolC family protein [Burkholderiaceae bacterium]